MKHLLLTAFLALSTTAHAGINFEQESAIKGELDKLHNACLDHAELFSRILYGHLSGTISKDRANELIAPHYAKAHEGQKVLIKKALHAVYSTPRDNPAKTYVLVGAFQISEYGACIKLGTRNMWGVLNTL